ncbi:A-factor biosynthesis protein [Streptacidiphilus sp. PB12-B1b]|uniref:ScbA/BarX family gamma-butyrolactone biosynthesis protein n=1 Tax=Streptacidiphilus sp. PB12-B1b TaxID=2705012 RepID=UPI0015FA43CC|nr:ScbA/BarX family gamma-butyrolactone biosynthesis protein [Streptacidiphilus sp. PB12-B1b]QMU76745.1 A-factor biosynthesis protein [Streptacidiphilus sp. PB12-B1b]
MHSWDAVPRTGGGRSAADGPRPLTWSRTVPRESVHRLSVAEVLLTDVLPAGPGRFAAAAQWPLSHPTFPRGGEGLHNPLMIVETLRQLGIYLPLRYCGVPPRSHFLITDVSYELDPAAEPRVRYGATEVTCLVEMGDVRRRAASGALSGMRLRARFLAGGRTFAQAEGGARILDAEGYTALRGPGPGADGRPGAPDGHPRAPAGLRPAPEGLGVASPQDVMLALAPDGVRVDPADPRHPYFFDHDSDHVPGMTLLEAARQAVAVQSEGRLQRPVGCGLRLLRFTEFSPAATVECTVHGTTCVFRIRQDAGPTAVGVLRYSGKPAAEHARELFDSEP